MATAGKWVSLRPKLSKETVTAVKSMGMKRMTPVQAASIGPLLEHKDVVVVRSWDSQCTKGLVLAFSPFFCKEVVLSLCSALERNKEHVRGDTYASFSVSGPIFDQESKLKLVRVRR